MAGRLTLTGAARSGAIVAAAFFGLVLPPAAGARPSLAAEDPVTITVVDDGRVVEYVNCDGTTVTDMTDDIRFRIERAEDGPPLTVNISVSDPDIVLSTPYTGSGVPDHIDFPPGVPDVTVNIYLPERTSFTMTVEPGEGYEVGSLASATAHVEGGNDQHASCHDLVTETIPVGATPSLVPLSSMGNGAFGPLDTYIGGEWFELRGELPPGVIQPQDADASNEELSGAATTPGVYEFTTAYCPGDGSFCVLEVPYRVTVVAAGSEPTEAPAASPVEASPTFTG
ncbi:MAG: hypothetical protein JWO77_1487 [Ilumatobacteraceae bacterium]|nr:hypothetical protein [Ilumatobacteraceae bacterium]